MSALCWCGRIPERTAPWRHPKEDQCALPSLHNAELTICSASTSSWCSTFLIPPPPKALTSSKELVRNLMWKVSYLPHKGGITVSLEVGSILSHGHLVGPSPDSAQHWSWAPTLMLLFSSEPSVRRKASWPSVPPTRRKQLVVWPIPEGRTLSQSMALITVLFPLLVLQGNNSCQPSYGLGFHDIVTSLTTVLFSAMSPVARWQQEEGSMFIKMVRQSPSVCTCDGSQFITSDKFTRCLCSVVTTFQ